MHYKSYIEPVDVSQPHHLVFVRQPLAEELNGVVQNDANVHRDEQKEPRRRVKR